MFVIEVGPTEEVLETIQRKVTERGCAAASITLIGAVDDAKVSVMNLDDPRVNHVRSYHTPAEITGTGEVVDGKVHFHVVLGMEDQTVAGHLHRATVIDHFVRAYVIPLEES